MEKELSEWKATEIEADKNKTCVSLAPTNLAELINDGTTIHKIAWLIKSYDTLKNTKIKYIFVDEVSMLQEKVLWISPNDK